MYTPQGELTSTISVPTSGEGPLVCNKQAIEAGTKTAYVTVRRKDKGQIFTFEALAAGNRQSDGG